VATAGSDRAGWLVQRAFRTMIEHEGPATLAVLGIDPRLWSTSTG
jgi:hypothetical protein